MKKVVRALSFVLMALMLFGIIPIGDRSMIETAEADGRGGAASYPNLMNEEIAKTLTIKQGSGACVIDSAAMMCRRAAIIENASPQEYLLFNEQFMINFFGGVSWNNKKASKGLTIGEYSYVISQLRGKSDGITKEILIQQLNYHPEGVVLYCWYGEYYKDGRERKHAILVTHYVSESDTFYCIDPVKGYGNGFIKIQDSFTGKKLGRDVSRILKNFRALWVITSGIEYHQHSYNSSSGDCVCGKAHKHQYDNNGVCKNTTCKEKDYGNGKGYDSNGRYYDYYSLTYLQKIIKAKSGTATPASGKSFPVYNDACVASGMIQVKGFLGLWNTGLKIAKAEIIGELKNHEDETWYFIRTAESPTGYGYARLQDIKVELYSEVTVTGIVAPTNGATPGRSVMAVEGKVSTNNGAKLDRVVAAVFRADKLSTTEKTKLQKKQYDAAAVLNLAEGHNSTSTKAFTYAHTESINAETFDLHDAYYMPLKFSQLSGGVEYIYVVYGTDTNGKTGYHYRSFVLKSSSNAVVNYKVSLNVSGSVVETYTVQKGQAIPALPEKSREGFRFLGWTDVEFGDTAKYGKGDTYTPSGDTTLYAVFEEILPPSVPNLTATSFDIAAGATQTVSWNAVSGATKYTAYVYDESGTKVYEQSTSGTTAAIPFTAVGTYTVRVEAFNASISGGSGQSAQCVTVRVHGPSTVTFENYDGSVWSVQSVPYNGTADRPTDPSRAGYTFSGWDGSFTNVKADRTITAKYTAIKYKVTFYDADGNVLSTQDVTYNEDTPGSAVEPDAPEKANYTFVGWSTGDWKNVTTSGIKVYPVYVWANEDIPFTVEITNVQAQGNGYWVSYTVENGSVESHTGRVVIAGKTRAGKFITQTESGAMHLDTTPQGRTYSGRLYVPVNGSDMATLATVEAYVVDDYNTTKPIAQPDSYLVGSIDGEYTAWMTQVQYDAYNKPTGSVVETKTQYRKRNKETITTQTSTYLDWTLVSTSKRYSDWGNWSAWQDTAVTANNLKQVETKQVQITAAHTEYRYGRWYATNVVGAQSGNSFAAASSPSFAHANYNYKDAAAKFGSTPNYSAWSSTRYNPTSSVFQTTLHDSGWSTHYGTKVISGKTYYLWHPYYLGSECAQNKFFWEETRQVAATYKTQYRYRTRTEITDYTFEHWTDWSAWSDTAVTASSTQQVDTRTLYRVKLPTASQGSTYVFSGEVGESAANKQAILTVYKVDSASDYSNEYIEQITLGGNGSYHFTFDTLEIPSVQTGDFTVTLTVEGATEPLYIGTIEAPKPQYTVRFVDEVTGDEIDAQTVSQGSAAVAPDAPVHEGYSFLGWEYGLGNIREDMIIAARYVKKAYTVVFIDGVNLTVTVMNDIPYGEPVAAPEVEAPEGYNFIGWQTAEGMNLDTVTGHMIVTAEYEHLTHTVTYMSAVTGTDEEGNAIATVVSIQTINHGEYAEDPIGYDADYDEEEEPDESAEPEEPDPSEEDPEIVDYENLNIPENMYFDGWSEGAEDPVTNDVIVTPVLRFFEDAAEVSASIEEGLYAGTQRITLMADAEDVSGISVQYRLNNGDGEAEWLDYDLASAPEIEIAETCLLEIEVNEPDKNGYAAAYEYIIVPQNEFPLAPHSMDAMQTDTETVTVSWDAVPDASGYMVRRSSDCDETAEFDVQSGTSFADGGVDPLRRYTYTVTAYKLAEKDGANVVLESQPTDEKAVFFFGDNTPVTNVEVNAPTTVIKGSATQLTASVTPDDAYDTTVIWTCTDGTGEGYVSDDGLFYGISAGTVTVTAKAFDGSEQYDSVEITVQEIDVGTATLTVSSALVRAGGTATVNVSVSENSLAEAIQFAVLYDSTKLELTNCEAGAVIKNLSPVINSTEEGVIYFNWDSITSLTAGGSLLDLTFKVKADATGPAVIEIPTDNAEYEFLFVNGSLEEIDIATVSGVLDISELLLGDVDGSGKVNIIDANMIRRHAAKLITLEEEQLLAADVNGDGKVNIIDANLIRRYVAHLIDVFPAEN